MRSKLVVVSMALLSAMVARAPVWAEDYPSRSVQVIVPQSPGGLGDIAVRVLAPELSASLGVPVVIENKPGAGGTVGMAEARRAAADGSTLALAAAGSFSINPHLQKNLPYDPLTNFEPVCRIGGAPSVLVVNPSLNVKSLPELLAKAKTDPVSFASGGNGTPSHLAQELLKARVKVQFLHVPYRGTSQAVTDTMGGHSQALFETAGPLLGAIRAGQLIALGVTSPDRLPALPDVPTFKELGIPDLDLLGWNGLVVPAGTPETIIARLSKACELAVSAPEFLTFAKANGYVISYAPAAEFRNHIISQLKKWGELVRLSGVKPQ
ncbi:tripartite tricarboxylate transporter substrate binding protein [Rhizobium leguminosarum]|nr:tripartite tricarboxylate transporter substrate binding protein [Rhizobium leguminosarum]